MCHNQLFCRILIQFLIEEWVLNGWGSNSTFGPSFEQQYFCHDVNNINKYLIII